ncbi:PLD nuclease N-terminal domain-containing protein [Salinimicrobium sp. GXAS 041]|uniref:PLD nuclease N-terminal domain-containing protein n=1 Tax=Salinimicrobium sp. GXAS 041 TaxID=3400806 RepID=UPI003C73CAC2
METTSIFILALVALTVLLWLWALIDLVRSSFKKPTYKILWLLAILVFPVMGSIFYFMLKKEFVDPGKRKFDPDFQRK